MKDMIVRLVDLPSYHELEDNLGQAGIRIRRPIAPERDRIIEWVHTHFSDSWKQEVEVALSQVPATCFIAQEGLEIIGFSCYDTTALNFFGPTGVDESYRGRGIGKLLLLKALNALREKGYAYAIIGGVGPEKYYESICGAIVIPGSELSIYQNMLRNRSRSDD